MLDAPADRRALPVQLEAGRGDPGRCRRPVMNALETLRQRISRGGQGHQAESAGRCSSAGTLTPEQRWGVAVASAIAARNPRCARRARGRARPASADGGGGRQGGRGADGDEQRVLPVPAHGRQAESTPRSRRACACSGWRKPATNRTDFELFSPRGERDQRLRELRAAPTRRWFSRAGSPRTTSTTRSGSPRRSRRGGGARDVAVRRLGPGQVALGRAVNLGQP